MKFKVGDKIRLKTGPLIGQEGVVVQVLPDVEVYTVKISTGEHFALAESDIESITEFKVGDIVEIFGVRGVVKTVSFPHPFPDPFPIKVWLDIGRGVSFTEDGRYFSWAKEPTLKLIERPKKKEKRTVRMWVNVYSNGKRYAYHSKEEAELGADETAIEVAVEMTGEYEVEVE